MKRKILLPLLLLSVLLGLLALYRSSAAVVLPMGPEWPVADAQTLPADEAGAN